MKGQFFFGSIYRRFLCRTVYEVWSFSDFQQFSFFATKVINWPYVILLLMLIYNTVDLFLAGVHHNSNTLNIFLTIVKMNFTALFRRSQITTVSIHDIFGFDFFGRFLTVNLDQVEHEGLFKWLKRAI